MKPALALLAPLATAAMMLAAVAACGRAAGRGDGADGKDAPALLTSGGGPATNALVGTARASCTMVDQIGTCNEYRRTSSFSLEKSLCEGLRGTFRTAGCEKKGQIGSCETSDGEIKRYYGREVAGPHALTLDEAQADCRSEQMRGTFTPEPASK